MLGHPLPLETWGIIAVVAGVLVVPSFMVWLSFDGAGEKWPKPLQWAIGVAGALVATWFATASIVLEPACAPSLCGNGFLAAAGLPFGAAIALAPLWLITRLTDLRDDLRKAEEQEKAAASPKRRFGT